MSDKALPRGFRSRRHRLGANRPRVTRSVVLHRAGIGSPGATAGTIVASYPLRRTLCGYRRVQSREISRSRRVLRQKGAIGPRTKERLEAPFSTVGRQTAGQGMGDVPMQFYWAGDRRGRACARIPVAPAHQRLDQSIRVRLRCAWNVVRGASSRRPSRSVLDRAIADDADAFRRER